MNARDIMISNPVTVSESAKVSDVARLMLERAVGALPVVAEDGILLGLITARDVVAEHARPHVPTYLGILGGILPITSREDDEELRRVLAVTAGDLMENRPVTAAPDAGVDDLASLMVEKRADAIPIVEDNRLVGLVSHSEIIRLLLIEEEGGEADASRA